MNSPESSTKAANHMGKRLRKKPGRLDKKPKARALKKDGTMKRKRGDLRLVASRAVGFQVKQRKGGKWKKIGERVCHIHTKCNCVARTDPALQRQTYNR